VSRLILCECGTVVRGGDERELLDAARRHMDTNHPAIAKQISDDELLALSHEDPALLASPRS
jgi:hypothetical protein